MFLIKKKKTLEPKKASRKRKNSPPTTRSLTRRGNRRAGRTSTLFELPEKKEIVLRESLEEDSRQAVRGCENAEDPLQLKKNK